MCLLCAFRNLEQVSVVLKIITIYVFENVNLAYFSKLKKKKNFDLLSQVYCKEKTQNKTAEQTQITHADLQNNTAVTDRQIW